MVPDVIVLYLCNSFGILVSAARRWISRYSMFFCVSHSQILVCNRIFFCANLNLLLQFLRMNLQRSLGHIASP